MATPILSETSMRSFARRFGVLIYIAVSACQSDKPLAPVSSLAGGAQTGASHVILPSPPAGSSTSVFVGDSIQLSSKLPTKRKNTITWSSSSSSIVRVNTKGLAVAAGVGSATITASNSTGTEQWSFTVSSTSPPPDTGALGLNAALTRAFFPPDNPWNTPIDTAAVDPNSAAIISNIGLTTSFHPDFGANYNGGPFGIPYVVVSGTQARVNVSFDYADESDPGPYPIPPNPPIEPGSDAHVLVVDRDNWKLYELFAAQRLADGTWHAGSGAIFDLSSNALRPAGWTSADAAGLPILPGLVRFDEVSAGNITHALRFTVSRSRRAYVYPARHWASSDTSSLRPPMGMRVRLKAV
jgi:hypothetical protein